MSRYEARYLLAVAILLGLPWLIAAADPLFGLRNRVRALEEAVGVLQTENLELASRVELLEALGPAVDELVRQFELLEGEAADLLQRVTALEIESDIRLVALDAEGELVGRVDATGPEARVAMEIAGYPPFWVKVSRDNLQGTGGPVRFTSTNCSGTALIDRNPRALLPEVFVGQPGATVYMPDQTGGTSDVLTSSRVDAAGDCVASPGHISHAVRAIPTVDLNSLFRSPFSIKGGRLIP